MTKIITVTLNPSLDETVITAHLNLGYYNHVADTKHLDASGRGINVSRALNRLNALTHAIIVLGNDAIGRAYHSLINTETFPNKIIQYTGPTRSDIIIVDKTKGEETHIVDEDSVGTRENIQPIIDALKEICTPDDTVIFSGNLPRDTPSDVYGKLIDVVHEIGAETILMTKGDALRQTLRSAPETVILVQREAEALFNHPVRTHEDLKSCGEKLQEYGSKRIITITDDYTCAILVDEDDVWQADNPDIDFCGTHSGVVDAMLAGFLAGKLRDEPIDSAFRLGMAAMSFTAEQIGNEFGTMEHIRPHLHKVKVSRYETTSHKVG